MEEKKARPAPSTLLPDLSAEEVHKNIMRCYHLRNRVDRKMLGWIEVFRRQHHAQELGTPITVRHIAKHLKVSRGEAYVMVKVARSLEDLPLLSAAFDAGDVSWTQTKAIAPIARPDTEKKWILFARDRDVGELEAEARDARDQGRRLPRDGRAGILNRKVDFHIRLSRADREQDTPSRSGVAASPVMFAALFVALDRRSAPQDRLTRAPRWRRTSLGDASAYPV
jgi:hypothetical protein